MRLRISLLHLLPQDLNGLSRHWMWEDHWQGILQILGGQDHIDLLPHAYIVVASNPQSFKEALGILEWDREMEEEYNSLMKNDTWDLVPLPKGRKLVWCKWIY